MVFFTWKDTGLTTDCQSLKSMAARYEEAAKLMRKMDSKGFKLEKVNQNQLITHKDQSIFNSLGFINEESIYKQLTLISGDN